MEERRMRKQEHKWTWTVVQMTRVQLLMNELRQEGKVIMREGVMIREKHHDRRSLSQVGQRNTVDLPRNIAATVAGHGVLVNNSGNSCVTPSFKTKTE
jgi:hypothetical protein